MKPRDTAALIAALAAGSPAQVHGIVISKPDCPKPGCAVKFHAGNLDACSAWVKKAFCDWTGLMANQVIMTTNPVEMTVEVKAA